jgi:aromatic-L-amino-acid decarboxylase
MAGTSDGPILVLNLNHIIRRARCKKIRHLSVREKKSSSLRFYFVAFYRTARGFAGKLIKVKKEFGGVRSIMTKAKEETLDPEDWKPIRVLGHRMLDDILDALENVRSGPVWEPLTESLLEKIKEPLPLEPQGAENTYRDLCEIRKMNRSANWRHPRGWAHATGNGNVMAAYADMIVSGLNMGSTFSSGWGYYVEAQVIEWFKHMLGYPKEASGIIVGGSSLANFLALAVARNAKAGYDVRKRGLQSASRKMTLYVSSEMHICLEKAVELLGLGNNSLRRINVDSNFQIDTRALETAISEDKEAGCHPTCVIGNAGTVNTGSFDNLKKLADICKREEMWFHVDGAFGAWAALSPKLRHLVDGMEKADSLAFDLHKWMYMPIGIACLLVRDKKAHYKAFASMSDYLAHDKDQPAWFSDLGIELSRGFKGLKAWMSIKEHGAEKYSRLIQQNVDQAQYLKKLVERTPELELLAPVPLNIVCFRYKVENEDDESLNKLNSKILDQQWRNGNCMISSTVIDGKYALRTCFTNHRSTREDIEFMVKELIKLGDEIAREMIRVH